MGFQVEGQPVSDPFLKWVWQSLPTCDTSPPYPTHMTHFTLEGEEEVKSSNQLRPQKARLATGQ